MIKKERITYIDIAKFLAMTCVIFGHKLPITALVWPFHLPIFFLIAGFFISDNGPMRSFALKKLASLIIPYCFTCLIICIFSIPLAVIAGRSVVTELKYWTIASLYGLGHDAVMPNGVIIPQIGAIWFLWAMFFSLILVRLLISLKRKAIQLIIAILLPIVSMISASYIWLPLSFQSACFAVPFIYIGYLIRINKGRVVKIYADYKYVVLVLCVFFAILGFVTFDGFSMNQCRMPNFSKDIIVACADTVLVLQLSKQINIHFPALSSICEMFGRMTIVMLCVHIIELNLMPWGKIQSAFLSFLEPQNAQIVLACVGYIMILLVTYIISKYALLRSIFGISDRIKVSNLH